MTPMCRGAGLLLLAASALAGCRDDAPLPITLTVTPLETGLRPLGQPLPFLVEIDFRYDRPMQNVRLFVEGAFADTVTIEGRFWASNLSRVVTVEVPLADITGPIRVSVGARVDDILLTSDTVTVEIGDVDRPRVHLSTPPAEATPGTPFIMGFSAADNSGIVAAEVLFGGAWSSHVALDAGGRDTLHEALTVTVPPGPAPGEDVTVAVVVRDVRGNADTARGSIRLVDRTAPTVAVEPDGYRAVMPWIVNTVRYSSQFATYLSGDTVRVRLRLHDAVGLSHVFVHDRILGTRDSIGLTGTSADLAFTSTPTTVSDERRGWIVVELFDQAGNVRRDSTPVGVFAARIPALDVTGLVAIRPRFARDGASFIDGSGTVTLFALAPLRVERRIAINGRSFGDADLSVGGDTILAVTNGTVGSANVGQLVIGPRSGGAESFAVVATVMTGDQPRGIAATRDGVAGITSTRGAFDNVARVAVPAGGAATDVEVGGADARVARPANGDYVLFGTGLVIGKNRTSGPPLAAGDISFDSTGTLVLAGDVLYDAAWASRDLMPGVTVANSALAPDGQTAWLGLPESPEILKVRVSDGAILDRVLVPFMTLRLTMSPTGEVLLAHGGGALAAVDIR